MYQVWCIGAGCKHVAHHSVHAAGLRHAGIVAIRSHSVLGSGLDPHPYMELDTDGDTDSVPHLGNAVRAVMATL